jgi:cytochrome P450
LQDAGLRSHSAILRETLRLQPPASSRGVAAIEDTVVGGGLYAVKAGVSIMSMSWVAMRDPAVWGEDAEEFRPERMLDGKFEALPVRFLLKELCSYHIVFSRYIAQCLAAIWIWYESMHRKRFYRSFRVSMLTRP